jgi:hypothetical protein
MVITGVIFQVTEETLSASREIPRMVKVGLKACHWTRGTTSTSSSDIV